MNRLRPLALRLSGFGALLALIGFFASPIAADAQRIQDLPTAGASTHQSITLPAKGAPDKAAPAPYVPLTTPFQPTAPKTTLATRFPWLTHLFAAIFLVSAIGLVGLLAVQTTKQEGLSGTIGGRVEAAYRPRLGFDQQLQRITNVAAISFVVFATIISLSGI